LPAITIAKLYKERWKIELFFKWIKQHLRIKSFYGLSENAIKIQIWSAIAMYVITITIKKSLKLQEEIYTILQILSVNSFNKVLLKELFKNSIITNSTDDKTKQLFLFDF
jgi:IS4 transposase